MERSQTHSIRTRTAHWTNALLVLFLLWTGFSMFSVDRDFQTYVRLVPQAFWHAIHFAGTKRQLVPLHEYAGLFFAVNGLLYVVWLGISGGWKRILPLGGRWQHDPQRPLDYSVPQRLAYSGILTGALVMAVTGIALWFRHQIPWLLAALGGGHVVLPVHVVLATLLLGFIGVHVSQVFLAGAVTFRSMTVGQASASGSSGIRRLRTRQSQ